MQLIILLLSVLGLTQAASVQVQLSSATLAPLIAAENAEIVPGEYIVMFNDASVAAIPDISAFATDLVGEDQILKVYVDGFAAKLSDELLSTVRGRPEVAFVEQNQVVSIKATQVDPPSWGLARIWQKAFTVKDEYQYPATAGEGVDVYVIDTGVFVDHADFEGRAVWGYTATTDGDTDGNGHGTHVAATIAGKQYGVAKKANIIAVKVLTAAGSGTMAGVIDGVQWAAKKTTESGVNSLGNMSLGGGRSPSLDRAVQRAISQGLHFAVAAGNSNTDACRSSPAGVEEVVTVAASTKEDTKAYFSNVGKCVDIWAPGHYITSAWIGTRTSRNTISGTSMASPHVAGVMALFLAEDDFTPAQLKARLARVAFKKVLSGVPVGTVNLLLNNAVAKDSENVESSDNEKVELYF